MRQPVLDLGKKRARERGGILVIAIIVILAMLILAIPFLFKLSASNRSTERAARALSALNLAEAGVDKYMWYISPDSDTSKAKLDLDTDRLQRKLPLLPETYDIHDLATGDLTQQVLGDVQIVLSPPEGVEPNPKSRNLDATGMVPFVGGHTVDRKVRVKLKQYFNSVFEYGFFVELYFYIHNSFFLDAYNSKYGAYGATLPSGVDALNGSDNLNWHSDDVFFGSNSYIETANPNDPGETTWAIDAGAGSSDVYGTLAAGGSEAEAYNNDTDTDPATNPPPDASLLDTVINVPKDDILQGDPDRFLMNQKYILPPVDVYNLPPKDLLGSMPAVGSWFQDYNSTDPTLSTGYYLNDQRLLRAPGLGDLANPAPGIINKGDFIGGTSLTSADSGIYTSFKPGSTLNVSGSEPVVIYVTALHVVGETTPPPPASFYLGQGSTINIAPGSKLIVILGNASMVVEKGYNINQSAGKPADCIILGTNQFAFPSTQDPNKLPKKLSELDDIPGLMYFDQGASDGNIYAAMYAPKAHLTTGLGQNHLNLYGSCLVNSMDLKCQVDFHYDMALADNMLVPGGYERWKIINWAEVVGGN
jgi:hypothetical protein